MWEESDASALSGCGIVPMLLGAPGIVGPHMALLRSVLLRSVEPRWVRQQQVPILMAPLAAITLIPRATERRE